MSLLDEDGDVSRRALLGGGLAAFLLGVFTARDGGDKQRLLPGGAGGSSFSEVSGSLIWASDYAAAQEAQQNSVDGVALAVTQRGNVWSWGNGTITMADNSLTVDIGNAESYDEARDLVDTYPTVVISTRGNQWVFSQ